MADRQVRSGPATGGGSNRVNRGGSWNNSAANARVANRNNDDPANRNNNLGFRLASTRQAPPPAPSARRAAVTATAPVPGICPAPDARAHSLSRDRPRRRPRSASIASAVGALRSGCLAHPSFVCIVRKNQNRALAAAPRGRPRLLLRSRPPHRRRQPPSGSLRRGPGGGPPAARRRGTRSGLSSCARPGRPHWLDGKRRANFMRIWHELRYTMSIISS
jgi:hypothetical protein